MILLWRRHNPPHCNLNPLFCFLFNIRHFKRRIKRPCSIQVSKTSSLHPLALPLKLAALTSVKLQLQFSSDFWKFPCPTAPVFSILYFFYKLAVCTHKITLCPYLVENVKYIQVLNTCSSPSHQGGRVEVAAMNSGPQIIHPDYLSKKSSFESALAIIDLTITARICGWASLSQGITPAFLTQAGLCKITSTVTFSEVFINLLHMVIKYCPGSCHTCDRAEPSSAHRAMSQCPARGVFGKQTTHQESPSLQVTTSDATRRVLWLWILGAIHLLQSRITEHFGLQRTLKVVWFQPPAMGTFHQPRLLNVSSHLSLHLGRKSVHRSSVRKLLL